VHRSHNSLLVAQEFPVLKLGLGFQGLVVPVGSDKSVFDFTFYNFFC